MWRVVSLLLVLAHLGCARAACPAPKVFAGTPRPFLWSVRAAGAARGYLYGTFHASSAADLPAAARSALESSSVFVSETGDLDSDVIRAAATLPRGQSLQTLLGADAWFELADALSGVISDEHLRHVRPWYAMSLLTAASSDMPDVVIDDALKTVARAHGARLAYLEEADQQLGSLGDSVSADDLKQALEERHTMRCEVEGLRAAYRAGDATAFADPLGSVTATQKLLIERNQRWMTALEGHLRAGGAFVAVGVGHLAGPGSLPELLTARGYTVERVP